MTLIKTYVLDIEFLRIYLCIREDTRLEISTSYENTLRSPSYGLDEKFI